MRPIDNLNSNWITVVGLVILLSVAGCANAFGTGMAKGGRESPFCRKYDFPLHPPVRPRDGQDATTDKEVISLLLWWELQCGA